MDSATSSTPADINNIRVDSISGWFRIEELYLLTASPSTPPSNSDPAAPETKSSLHPLQATEKSVCPGQHLHQVGEIFVYKIQQSIGLPPGSIPEPAFEVGSTYTCALKRYIRGSDNQVVTIPVAIPALRSNPYPSTIEPIIMIDPQQQSMFHALLQNDEHVIYLTVESVTLSRIRTQDDLQMPFLSQGVARISDCYCSKIPTAGAVASRLALFGRIDRILGGLRAQISAIVRNEKEYVLEMENAR
ncbi:hypothetical protein BJ508DRAFT_336877 [Ascobolus immersus RN42]|uniref:Uncharacterized protein n=1 Tax=Ascobolus immersus RN42 TaxID=1160509 RepID=A0A3N4HEW2_ASCIM|nr:hypothetical protein BJ508DRAFT_336877 [Ascobolus immersus RN42]